jgi:hypothetical protein
MTTATVKGERWRSATRTTTQDVRVGPDAGTIRLPGLNPWWASCPRHVAKFALVLLNDLAATQKTQNMGGRQQGIDPYSVIVAVILDINNLNRWKPCLERTQNCALTAFSIDFQDVSASSSSMVTVRNTTDTFRLRDVAGVHASRVMSVLPFLLAFTAGRSAEI